jgi:hypothetical protein
MTHGLQLLAQKCRINRLICYVLTKFSVKRIKKMYFEGERLYLACSKLYQSATSDSTSEQINIMWVIMWNL